MRFLSDVDFDGSQIKHVALEVLAAAPSSPVTGYIYFDSVLGYPRTWSGTAWVGGSGGGSSSDASTLGGHAGSYYLDLANTTGARTHAAISDFDTQVRSSRLDQLATPTVDVAMGGHKLTGLADPTAAQDAATQAYVLARISLLVNSAPGVLDTLVELAAALGNDANFSATVAAQIADAKLRANHSGTQLAATISDFSTAADLRIAARDYVATVGNGSLTSITITHNLGSQDVVVQLRQAASPYAYVGADIAAATTNTVTLAFTNAPALNEYRVLITRIGA